MDPLGKAALLIRRARNCLDRGRVDDDLREEMLNHLELRRRQLEQEGMDPADAHWAARRAFGNATTLREDAREVWRVRLIDSLAKDIRFAGRFLRRSPLFTAVAVMSLSIGIGASVAVFKIADAVLFRPLAVRAPSELRSLNVVLSAGPATKRMGGADDETFRRIAAAGFADFAGVRTADEVTFESGGTSRLERVQFVSSNYFDVLGTTLNPGRGLSASDDGLHPLPIVVSDRLWRAAWDADEQTVGRVVHLNGKAAIVVGIVRRFRGVTADRPADVFAPLSAALVVEPTLSNSVVQIIGRVHAGVAKAEAEEKLKVLFIGPGPAMFRGAELSVTLDDASRGLSSSREELERPLWLGLLLVAVLLLVACANTGGLLLSRFAARRGEFRVRMAIGAGRWRLARQLLVEATLLAAVSAIAGLIIGELCAPLLMALIPGHQGGLPSFDLTIDGRVAIFTVTVAAFAALTSAAASLIKLRRAESLSLLDGESRSSAAGTQRLTRILIAAQVGCSLLLVVGAVSMGRTLIHLRQVPPGFDPDQTFTVTVNASGLVMPGQASAYHARLNQLIAALPGVRRATLAQLGPLTSATTVGSVDISSTSSAPEADRIVRMFFVGPDYFETLGMPLVAGRGILAADTGGERVAVVNERFASFFFGSPQDALGRIVNKDVRIVGVAADAHYNSPRDEVPRAMFVPYQPVQRTQMTHIVRAAGDRSQAMRAVRETIASFDSRLRPRISTSEDLFLAALARERFFSTIATTLSSLALLLACAGLYAAVAYAVSQRRAEIAVRLALGASTRNVMSLVLKDPLLTICAGVLAGVPAAYAAMRSLATLLFGVGSFEPLTVVSCAAALVAAGMLAAAIPARRATRIDPAAVLRNG